MGIVERQCVACRNINEKASFLRIVRTPADGVAIDPLQKINGRGVYLCPNADCISSARKLNLISGNLHVEIDQTIYSRLAEIAAAKMKQPVKSFLGLAIRGGNAVLGIDLVRLAIKRGKVYTVLLSPEISRSSREKLEKICSHTGVPVINYNDIQPMDIAVGKANCRAAGITDRKLAFSIIKHST